ncbi:unnamed protein product, partial [Acanthoscelides obtectus]
TSKEIQNDLLDCILEVCLEEIIKQINRASYLAIIADETTDISEKTQLVTIFRYVFKGEPVKRFWNYMNPDKCDADTLTRHILSVVDPLIGNFPNKLISQSYDGGAVMSGHNAGVQAKIKQRYPFAHYVHQLNLLCPKLLPQMLKFGCSLGI